MNLEYAAGLIDGEGHIGISRTTLCYQIRLTVNMSDKGLPALHWLHKTLGGRLEAERPSTRPTHRPTTAWRVSGEEAGELLTRLRPHLLVKAQPADVALQFHEMLTAAPMRPSRGRSWTDEMRERGRMLMLRIQELNRTGPDPDPPILPKGNPLAIYRWGWWWEPEETLMGPVEFEGKFPTCGQMVAGHVYELPPMSL